MGQANQYNYHYLYDSENRITEVRTSKDKIYWERDGRYDYYLHGPLARTTLGDQLVQGIDYAYTLQGWLKGANAINHLNGSNDIGKDGNAGSSNQFTARDAFGFNLNYFGADYKPINSGVNPFPSIKDVIPDSVNSYRPLFNGNISSMAVNIVYPNATAQQAPQLYNYKYDQLNRITRMDMYRTATLNSNSWAGMALINDYKERTSYDANGNILTYLREGFGASTSAMDSLSYLYNYSGGKLTSNRLNYVRDRIGNLTTHSSNYTDDIEDQAAGNYSYDAIGNLTSDAAESITSILWNVYGKISRITRTATANNNVTQIRYSYDPSGNRISKAVAKSATDSIEYTFYARDASGNVMATYYGKDAPDWTIDTVTTGGHVKPPLYLQEQHLYGSSRLGVLNRNISIGVSTFVKPSILNFTRGNKLFELSNHLGNVLVTISDKKIGVDTNSDGIIDYYTADVITASDYHPGGMEMSGRKFNSDRAVYGFNGKRKDNEMYDEGNSYDYGDRIYNPRAVVWLSTDKLQAKRPGESPYLFVGGNPIYFNDPDGKDRIERIRYIGKDGTVQIRIVRTEGLFKAVWNNTYSGVGYATKNDYVVSITHDFKSGKDVVSSSTETLYGSAHATETGFGTYLKIKAFGRDGDILPKTPQIMVFGSSDKDPGWGEKADTKRPVTSINLSEANSLLKLIMTGMKVPNLEAAKPEKIPEIMKKFTDKSLEKEEKNTFPANSEIGIYNGDFPSGDNAGNLIKKGVSLQYVRTNDKQEVIDTITFYKDLNKKSDTSKVKKQ